MVRQLFLQWYTTDFQARVPPPALVNILSLPVSALGAEQPFVRTRVSWRGLAWHNLSTFHDRELC